MKRRHRSVHPIHKNDPKFKTRQEPAGQSDINGIVERARRGIVPTWINTRKPIFADMTQVPRDLLEAYQKIDAAEAAFMALPAKLRTEMDNNPLNLEPWLADPANRKEAEFYGLMEKREPTPSPASPEPEPEPEAPPAPRRGAKNSDKKIEE